MKKYLLPETGTFYKANLHCHSNISDGKLSPNELKQLYKSNGYSILAYTDHDIFIPHHELSDNDFLALAGFELQYNEDSVYPATKDTPSTHVCFIAGSPDVILHPDWNEKYAYIGNAAEYVPLVKFDPAKEKSVRSRSFSCVNESIKKARDAGFFVTYNHPTWSLDNYETYTKFNGMHAMEIFNYNCDIAGHHTYVPNIYDDMLRSGKNIFAVAADDNHNKYSQDNPKFDSFGGFTMIKADELTYSSVMDALFKGNFYSSQGPSIYSLYTEDNKIHIRCSDAKMIFLNTNRRNTQVIVASEGESINEAEFSLDREDKYIRITVKDSVGKYANTNAYFTNCF